MPSTSNNSSNRGEKMMFALPPIKFFMWLKIYYKFPPSFILINSALVDFIPKISHSAARATSNFIFFILRRQINIINTLKSSMIGTNSESIFLYPPNISLHSKMETMIFRSTNKKKMLSMLE